MNEKERKLRHKRIRSQVKGTKEVPRLCVYRSNKHTYAQLIDDRNGQTLAEADDMELEEEVKEEAKEEDERKVNLAYEVGKLIGEKAQEEGIKEVVFDRAGYRYHGRVKAVAEGAREKLDF